MSDARFASFKTDPRFRRLKKHQSKVVLDDRFKDLLGAEKKSRKKRRQGSASVDKYGRTVSENQETDDLRRFYRLEADDPAVVDYARGAVLMESSDEDEDAEEHERGLPRIPPPEDGSDSDRDGFVALGAEPDEEDKNAEVDLDENTIATLDAQVAAYAKAVPERELVTDVEQTRRLAVVNLDWDHVRAVHLYKIFSSLVSATAPLATSHADKTGDGANVARGRILSVRVYPSEFGKKRMAREDAQGPPVELFRKKNADKEIDETTIIETGSEADYDEDALRKYQLERLRYYYAIVECDTVETAAHVYDELEGTELERSANVFDLSFVPDNMSFEDEPRDEATQLANAPYRAVEFVTDALRHSKVKLTWDGDDPERTHFLRRPLTKKEIDEADFRAYVASSSSSEGSSGDEGKEAIHSAGHRAKNENESKTSKKAERDRLRTLLLGGNDDEMPEGWGDAFDNKASRGKEGRGEDDDADMEVTFMPGLSETKNPEDENTLERYQRKMKEKRKRKKESAKKNEEDGDDGADKTAKSSLDDEFFGIESDSAHEEAGDARQEKSTRLGEHTASSKAELALLATSDNPHGEPAHFDMKAILKSEKQAKKKSRKKSKKQNDEDDVNDEPRETQDDFVMDVKDDRFAALHEDHQFAIDPTHPQFKKTKGMAALLGERSRREKSNARSDGPLQHSRGATQPNDRSLQSLVESVKRKNASVDRSRLGKRRRLGSS